MNITEESRQLDLFNPGDGLFINTGRCVPAFKADAMNPAFWSKVVELSKRLFGITINSAFRPTSWEYARHRSGLSQHCFGLAVDISCADSEYRYKLISNALDLKFKRILIYPTFVHLDDKPDSQFKIVYMENVH